PDREWSVCRLQLRQQRAQEREVLWLAEERRLVRRQRIDEPGDLGFPTRPRETGEVCVNVPGIEFTQPARQSRLHQAELARVLMNTTAAMHERPQRAELIGCEHQRSGSLLYGRFGDLPRHTAAGPAASFTAPVISSGSARSTSRSSTTRPAYC